MERCTFPPHWPPMRVPSAFFLGVYFRALGLCAGGAALACVSSPCTQCAAWTQQLNRGESQPSLNVQLPHTHSFKRHNAMLFLVSMSFSHV